MKKTSIKKFKKSIFYKTLNFKKLFWKVFGIDMANLFITLIFFLILMILIGVASLPLVPYQEEIQSVEQYMQNMLDGGNAGEAPMPDDGLMSALKTTIQRMLFFSILILAIFLAISTLIKSITWSIIYKEKFTKKYYKSALILTSIWNVGWILLLLIVPLMMRNKAAIVTEIILMFIYLYFSLAVYPIFAKLKKPIAAIKETFKFGILKFYYFLPNVLLLIVILPLLALIINLISKISPIIAGILIIALSLLYLTWVKFYMFNLIDLQFD